MLIKDFGKIIGNEFKGYNIKKFGKDALAGVTVAAVALPLALAFGVSSGATAAAGLVTAIFAGLIIGGLAGASYQISGPTGAMTAILASLVAQYGIQGVFIASFIAGTLLFFFGMLVNWHSDYVIRHLRKPGDTRHYLPQKGMYRYVTSANYFGEIIEWAGWAILTCSLSGLVFLWWTIANLVPRAHALWRRYREEFGDAVGEKKRVFPFLY